MKSTTLVLSFAAVHGLRFDASVSKEYPVSKVVQLIKDMKAQLEKEQEADEEIYEKLACWCETNDKEKTKAVADAEAKLANLQAKIETLTAQSAQLNVELEGLEKEVAANQKSLDVATALREKQLAEFNDEEKEMLEAIKSLGAAVVVLSKHHSASLLDQRTLASVAALARNQMVQHQDMLRGAITPSQRRVITSFAQDSAPKYEAQSGEIFGILNQMKETFEANLAQTQEEEKSNAQAYDDLKKAKEAEIAAGQSSIDEKKQLLASTDETLAQSKEDREDTQAGLSSDEKFLLKLKETCKSTDSEWEERQRMRQEEIGACAKAIAILASDDARDQFSKTFNSFLQVSHSSLRSQASQLLAGVAAKTSSSDLAALAVSVKLDAFTQVKQAIDDMVADLEKEKAEEIKHRDYCIENLNENERDTAEKAHIKGRQEQKKEALESEIKSLGESIADLESQIAEMNTQLTRAKEDREAEHEVYLGTLKDQQETESLLTEALSVLKGVYKSPTDAFLQLRRIHQPEGFSEYHQNEGAVGIVMMIEQIIADTKAMQAEAKHDEQKAKDEYTNFKEETTKSIEQKRDQITDLKGQKSKTDEEAVEVGEELDGTKTDLENLSNDKNALKGECDFILKNFDVRQEARDEEVEALKQAKAILSGMKVN
jgi:septal ring factor EnvC (AmiA/AmiB activator)